MRLICGLCRDVRFGDLVPDLFRQTIRDHLALHRKAGDDPVTRVLSPTSYVLVKRGDPNGYFRIGEIKYRLEVDFEKPVATTDSGHRYIAGFVKGFEFVNPSEGDGHDDE